MSTGHVYVAVFNNGFLKVGFSRRNPKIRIQSASLRVKNEDGSDLVDSYISSLHHNANRTEVALIEFCNARYRERPFSDSSEWFISDDLGADLMDYAKSLDLNGDIYNHRTLEGDVLQSIVIKTIESENQAMLCVNDLHRMGNEIRAHRGLGLKQIQSYFGLASTKELFDYLKHEDGYTDDQIHISRRGKDGGTWVHPIVFIDMAMWYSPELKVQVIKWALERALIKPKNESGDSFKLAMSALTDNFPEYFEKPINYTKVSNAIAAACGVGTDDDKWQRATEVQLKLRDDIQDNIVLLADVLPSVAECVNTAIAKAKKKALLN